ncbi:hypothetical protein FHG87_005937 [Trinorchestia longiramus]|nr:hypothetical protein FHG87_005937 [Trinorchestia longiramus]
MKYMTVHHYLDGFEKHTFLCYEYDVLNRMASLQTSTATRPVFTDHRANRTEEVNPATRLGPVTTRSTTLTDERSRSGSRVQPTALYNEAATLCVTESLPSAFKVNIARTLIT